MGGRSTGSSGILETAGINVPVTQGLASSRMAARLTNWGNAVDRPVRDGCLGLPSRALIDPAHFIHTGPEGGDAGHAGTRHPEPDRGTLLNLADEYRPLAVRHIPSSRARAPVRKVSLEHVTLDLSALPAAGVSDKVVLLGENGGESISFTHIAEWQGARPHHVLTGARPAPPHPLRGRGAGTGRLR